MGGKWGRKRKEEVVNIYKISEVIQLCPTLCDPMDCSPPCSSFHGIFQARVLEGVASSFSRGSSWHRVRTRVSCIVGRHFTLWATREVPYTKLYHIKMRNIIIIAVLILELQLVLIGFFPTRHFPSARNSVIVPYWYGDTSLYCWNVWTNSPVSLRLL